MRSISINGAQHRSHMKSVHGHLIPVMTKKSQSNYLKSIVMGNKTSKSKTPTTPSGNNAQLPIVGPDKIMSNKAHGTCPKAVQGRLRWNLDTREADKICCYNRHFAENRHYWSRTSFKEALKKAKKGGLPIVFRDSVTGIALFKAPSGRSWSAFEKETRAHGWPSFRDEEVIWDNVRCLANGETVSTTGTHLGHNLADGKGNRYCINLISVAGYELDENEQPIMVD